jgi:hypothetical protein
MIAQKILTRVILCTLFLLSSALTSLAQDAKPSSAETKTKLEAFQAKTGVVIIKGFSDAGSITDQFGGSLKVQSREFRDATSGLRVLGVTIQLKESSRLERESTSFIDYDEIDSLIKGLDYVSKIDNSSTQLSNFEAGYRTRGDLEITTFSDSKGNIGSAVSSGSIGRVTTFFKLEDLTKIRQLIIDAKAKLDSIRPK